MAESRTPTEFSASDLMHLLWRRKRLFLLPCVGVTLLTLAVGSLLPKGYTSKTITKIVVQSYLDKIYAEMSMASSPRISREIAEVEIKNKGRLRAILEEERMLAGLRTEVERQEFIKGVADRIEVEVITPQTGTERLLVISYTGRSPFEAQSLVSRITQDYINRLRQRHRERLRAVRDKALEEKRRAEAAYWEARDRLQEFEEEHVEDLMGGEITTLERTLERIDEKAEEVATEITRLETEVKSLELTLQSMDPEIVKYDRVPNPKYAPLAQLVQGLEAQLAQLLAIRLPDHPLVVATLKQYEKAKARLAQTPQYLRNQEIREPNPRYEETRLALRRARAELAHLQETRVKFVDKRYRLAAAVKRLPMVRAQHQNLLDALERANDRYKFFMKKYTQAVTTWNRAAAGLEDMFVPVESASKPLRHSTPPPALILLIALALGLAAGLGTVFFLEVGRKTFATPEDVAALVSLPVVGVLHTILSRRERERLARKRAAALVATLIVAIGLTTLVYVYNRNPELLPDFVVTSVQRFKELL